MLLVYGRFEKTADLLQDDAHAQAPILVANLVLTLPLKREVCCGALALHGCLGWASLCDNRDGSDMELDKVDDREQDVPDAEIPSVLYEAPRVSAQDLQKVHY